MIKMTMLLKRKAGLSHEEFVDHHIHRHGPLFRSIPEVSKHVLRYLQTHPVSLATDVVDLAPFDGTAEIWFDSEEGMRAVLTSTVYRQQVFPDEQTFLDHEHTLTTVGKPLDIIGQPGA